MNDHDFCRTLLKVTRDGLKQSQPARLLKAEIHHKIKIGRHTTYFTVVTDHVDPASGEPGHFRSMTYEVEACCTWCARVEAINTHLRKFDPETSS